jgi:hypothetical protein
MDESNHLKGTQKRKKITKGSGKGIKKVWFNCFKVYFCLTSKFY